MRAKMRPPDAPSPSMSHKHDNLIREIFQDPISTNIQWREIESLLGAGTSGGRRICLTRIGGRVLNSSGERRCGRSDGVARE